MYKELKDLILNKKEIEKEINSQLRAIEKHTADILNSEGIEPVEVKARIDIFEYNYTEDEIVLTVEIFDYAFNGEELKETTKIMEKEGFKFDIIDYDFKEDGDYTLKRVKAGFIKNLWGDKNKKEKTRKNL